MTQEHYQCASCNHRIEEVDNPKMLLKCSVCEEYIHDDKVYGPHANIVHCAPTCGECGQSYCLPCAAEYLVTVGEDYRCLVCDESWRKEERA